MGGQRLHLAAGARARLPARPARSGPGQALPQPVRARLQVGFGADLTDVRVHDDSAAHGFAARFDALAVAVGEGIYLGRRAPAPWATGGLRLIAHEVAHVLQQRAASAPPRMAVTEPAGPQETAADAAAVAVLAGGQAPAPVPATAAAAPVRTSAATEVSRFLALQLPAVPEYPSRTLGPGDFSDRNALRARDQAYGGSMNKLDEVEYNFRPEAGRREQGSFVGLFKREPPPPAPKPAKRAGAIFNTKKRGYSATRAPAIGIAENDQRVIDRNLATAAVDQLLGGGLIPPTFAASHRTPGATSQVPGVVTEKVEGVAGDTDAGKQLATDPVVGRGLSNLYLLDTITGQIDRHPGNYIIETRNGVPIGVRGIDNDLSFGDKYTSIDVNPDVDLGGKHATLEPGYFTAYRGATLTGKSVYEVEKINRDYADRVVALAATPHVVRAAVQQYLKPSEVTATLSRLTSLAAYLQPLLTAPNGRIKG
jgi:hypothetical protein